MLLLPIDIDETKNAAFVSKPECREVLSVYPRYYELVGYQKPWIGYFASMNGEDIVGAAGYKGGPKDGKIEIAYGVFEPYQGQGLATQICLQLVLLSLQADPVVKITARTLPDGFASQAVLKKNGFVCLGTVHDKEDGEVLEWEFKGNPV